MYLYDMLQTSGVNDYRENYCKRGLLCNPGVMKIFISGYLSQLKFQRNFVTKSLNVRKTQLLWFEHLRDVFHVVENKRPLNDSFRVLLYLYLY